MTSNCYQIFFVFFLIISNFHTPLCGQQTIEPDTTLARQIVHEIKVTEYSPDYQAQFEKLAQAVAIFEKARLWEDWVDARTEKINILYAHYLFEDGLKEAQELLKFLTKKIGAEHPTTIDLYIDIAKGIWETDDKKNAWTEFQKGLELSKKVNGETHETTGEYYRWSAHFLQELGESKLALNNAQKALEIMENKYGKTSSNLVLSLMTLGDINSVEGFYADAKLNYERAISFTGDENEKTWAILGELNHKLGIVLDGMWNWREGISKYEKAIELTSKVYGITHRKVGRIQKSQGKLFYRWSFFDHSEVALKAALNIFKHDSICNNEDIGNAYLKLGSLYHVWKKNEQASPYLDTALLFIDTPEDLVELYDVKSRVFIQLNRMEEALEATNNCLKYVSLDFNNQKVNDNPKLENILKPIEALWSLFLKSQIFYKLWESNHEIHFLHYANETLDLAETLVDQKRIDFQLQEGYVNQLMDIGFRIYWQLAEINLALNKETQEQKYFDIAFEAAEKRKSLQLRAYKKGNTLAEQKIPAKIIKKGDDLSKQILDYEIAINVAVKNGDIEKINNLRDGRLDAMRISQKDYLSEIKTKYPNYYNSIYNIGTANPVDIQQELDEKTLFIEYLIQGKDSIIYAFLLEKNKQPDFVKIDVGGDRNARATTINLKISGLYEMLQGGNLIRVDRRKKFVRASNDLYKIFIEPIKEKLVGKEHLVFINDGLSNYLPFEVLLSSDEFKPFSELNFLIKNHSISYHHTGKLYLESKKQKDNHDKDLLAFAPVFSEESVAAIQNEDFRSVIDSTHRSMRDGHFEQLIHSEVEVKTINDLFLEKGLKNATVLTHGLAEEAVLKSALSEHYRVVHIATHSFANVKDAKFSGIACAQPAPNKSEEKGEDGILYMSEIQNLEVNADLVVLSSCESGFGKVILGDGVLGLNRSFVYAGAPNVIFSLWKVYDKSTAELMTYFYKEMLDGKTYSAALRGAKLRMLENSSLASPEFWGAFLLIGE